MRRRITVRILTPMPAVPDPHIMHSHAAVYPAAAGSPLTMRTGRRRALPALGPRGLRRRIAPDTSTLIRNEDHGHPRLTATLYPQSELTDAKETI